MENVKNQRVNKNSLYEARFAVLQEEQKNLDMRALIRGVDGFEDDLASLAWRFHELEEVFWSDDIHLMFSAAKLASHHHAAVESKFIQADI